LLLPPSDSSSALLLKADIRGRVRTPPEQRRALLDAFDASSMSGAEFARHHGLTYPTFMAWLAARKRQGSPPVGAGPSRRLFHEVVLDVRPDSAALPHGLVVELPGGARLRVEHPGQIPLAAAMLRELGGASC